MSSIHRIVLRRLLAAWLLVSAAVGLAVFYVETEKVDETIVALAARRAAQFSAEELEGAGRSPEQIARLEARAQEFARDNFVVVEIYDRNRNSLAEAANPLYEDVEQRLREHAHAFPLDDRSHYERYNILGHPVVMVLVPLKSRAGALTGYFEGVFLVDKATEDNLRASVLHTLGAALVAVLLTTVVLYPVIVALNRDVLRFSGEVMKGNLEMGAVLGAAIAKRDSDTGDHNYRVALYAIALGEDLGLDAPAMRHLIIGAFLHDVGKIGISDNILLKPGRLTPEEFAVMRTHVTLGVDIVAASEWLAGAREIIEFHHEKFDGSGYLQGLKGEAIPLSARIFAIVDVFDALTSRRPYKEPFGLDQALSIIAADAGRHFDPRLTARFQALAGAIHAEIGEAGEAELAERLRQAALHYFMRAAVSHRG